MAEESMLVFQSTLAHRGVSGNRVSTCPSVSMILGLWPMRQRQETFAQSPPTGAVVFKLYTNSARADGASLFSKIRAYMKRQRV